MIKVDIFSGFLGAGKTTLIKKLIKDGYKNEKLVLIENEFGEIGIDGGFLKDSGVTINEMNSGCICCSLVGDFADALKTVVKDYNPDRIIIEPSGVGKLSDIAEAVENAGIPEIEINAMVTVVDAKKAKVYMKNFGEFYNNQVESAGCIIFSHTDLMTEDKIAQAVELIKEKNDHATFITTDWQVLSCDKILAAMENKDTLAEALELLEEEHEHHHHHDHNDHDHECGCGHHHHDDDHDHHDHDHECGCGHHHDHEHHGHHHADEVFDSIGFETTKKFGKEDIENALKLFSDFGTYGQILRAKGIVEGTDGQWIHFDYVPGEPDIRTGSAEITGRICVIGAGIDEDEIRKAFGL